MSPGVRWSHMLPTPDPSGAVGFLRPTGLAHSRRSACAHLRARDVDLCMPCHAQSPRHGLPRERWVCLLQGWQKGRQGIGALPSKAAAALVGGRGAAGPHSLISLSALRSWQELPKVLCWWLDLEGVQATWLPSAWGAAAVGVQGLTGPPSSILCPPLNNTASSVAGAQASGFRG